MSDSEDGMDISATHDTLPYNEEGLDLDHHHVPKTQIPEKFGGQTPGNVDSESAVPETQVGENLVAPHDDILTEQDVQMLREQGPDQVRSLVPAGESTAKPGMAPLTPITLFSRPMDDDIGTGPGFIYGKASKPALDMRGTRKGATVAASPETTPAMECQVEEQDIESMCPPYTPDISSANVAPEDVLTAPAITVHAEQVATQQTIAGLDEVHVLPAQDIDTTFAIALSDPAAGLIKKKRKKRKRRNLELAAPSIAQNTFEAHMEDRMQHFASNHNAIDLHNGAGYGEHDTEVPGNKTSTAHLNDVVSHCVIPSAQPALHHYDVAVGAEAQMRHPIQMALDEQYAGDTVDGAPTPPSITKVLGQSIQKDGHMDRYSVSKQTSRRRARHNSQRRAQESGNDADSQTMSDALEDIHDMHRREKNKASAEVDQLNAELKQTIEARETVQVQLNDALHQNHNMVTMLQQQKGKVSAYETKLKSFADFMSTMRTDLDDLQQTHVKVCKAKEHLVHTCQEHRLEHGELSQRLQQMAVKNAEEREQGLEVSREMKTELDALRVHNKFLESYLSDSKGQLIEERDRKSQAEAQLAAMTETLSLTTQNHEAALERIEAMNTVLGSTTACEQLTDFVEKVSAALRGLDGQQVETANNVTSVMDSIRTLSDELVATKANEHGAETQDTILSQMRSTLREMFTELKTDLEKHGQLMEHDATQQESIAILQDRNQTTSDQCKDLQAQLSVLRQNELQLQNTNATLRAKLTALDNAVQPELVPDDGMGRDADALRTAKLEVHSKMEELQAVRNELHTAHEQLQLLRIQVEDLQRRSSNAAAQRQRLQGDVEMQLEQARAEMKRHSDKVLDEKMAEYKNRMRELKSDNELLNSRVQPLHLELAARQAEKAEADRTAASVQAKHEEALLRATREAQSWKHKAETKASMAEESTKHKLDDISQKLAAEQTSHQRTIDEKTAISKHVESLQLAVQQAQSALSETKRKLMELQDQHATSLNGLREELATAHEVIGRHNARLKHLSDECTRAVEAEKQKTTNSLEALQHSLSEVQDELRQEKQNGETFRVDIERAWKAEQEDCDSRLGALSQDLTQAEAQRDQTMLENERLRKQIQDIATHHQQSLGIAASDDSHKTATLPNAHGVAEDITPTVSNKENDPPRPRKKVDRQSLTVTETGPIPILDVLRPDSRQKSADGGIRGPVVEESQLEISTMHVPATQYSHDGNSNTEGRLPSGAVSNISDEMLENAASHTQRPSHIVEETQFNDDLPSFAAFNNGTSTAAPKRKTTSGITVPSAAGAHSQSSRPSVGREGSLSGPTDTSQGFTIFGDQMSQTSLPSQSQLQNSLTWTDAEKEKYTFRKTYPPPNSASKMAPRNDKQTKRRRSDSRSNSSAHRTPPLRGVADKSSVHHSSTPDYINAADSGHKQANHASGGYDVVSRRRISRTNPQTKANPDPRLHARNMAAPAGSTKRKADAPHIVEGYEHERKKRKDAAASKSHAQSSRYPLRTNSHPSINVLPQMPRSSSSRGAPTQSSSRMRTLGGSSSRSARGGKKASKSDQFNARFSQELREG